MPKTVVIGSEFKKIIGEWKESHVDDRENEISDHEAVSAIAEYLANHPDCSKATENIVLQHIQSVWNGIKLNAVKDVGLGEQGELFHDGWFAHGIMTPEGYCPNGATTLEHREIKHDQLRRKIDKIHEQLEIEVERTEVLTPGFASGAKNSKEALSYVSDVKPCKPARTRLRRITN